MEIKKTIMPINLTFVKTKEIYHKKGDINYWHREDGPACIYRNSQGTIVEEQYWVNNRLHNENGPAHIEYNNVGNIICCNYWDNNSRITKEEWYEKYGWKSKLKGTPMGEIYGN